MQKRGLRVLPLSVNQHFESLGFDSKRQHVWLDGWIRATTS